MCAWYAVKNGNFFFSLIFQTRAEKEPLRDSFLLFIFSRCFHEKKKKDN